MTPEQQAAIRRAVARQLWENWRTIDLANEDFSSISFDEVLELAELPSPRGDLPRRFLAAADSQADVAIAAHVKALEAAGIVSCPVEPTDEMIAAAQEVLDTDRMFLDGMPEIVRAAIAARPR